MTKVEFITMAPTSGDSEYVGNQTSNKGAQTWSGVGVDSDREPSVEYITKVAQAAEKAGFSTLLLPIGGSCVDSLVAASHLTAHTKTLNYLIAVRPGSTAPTQLAKQYSSVNYWSNNRVFVNVVTGGAPKELENDGDFLSHTDRYKRTREYIEILKRLFNGETFDYNGEFYTLKGANLPLPVKNAPPIFFGGSSPIAKEVATDVADVYMLWGETLETTKQELDSVVKLAKEKNRDLSYSVSFQVVLGETEEAAFENANKIISQVDPEVLEAKHANTVSNGAVGVSRLHQLMLESKDNNFVIAPNIWAGLTQVLSGNSIALVGTPQQVAERIVEFVDLGFDKVLLRGFPHLEVIEEIGEKVIPLVHEILAKREEQLV
ncbi:Alkanesulfonate monooxygenase [Solibacillus isronensis B3W22]|uniref:Alkanesulfonate monooxygenase n=1 Tax=Solibacillus isronensis B3W22 TaxID=1224748 RepID=K1L2K3_9BACL|nr:LLM class flavin-dependent oxidoreductase [Solibacillus isronensis]AMO85638.1 alkanesulfonate monooxygenase [Solibacillus silvestris]EKB46282.1 Alkanesulfonate monooxygenase [Solibacillus isronensis B3W22]